MEVLSINQIRDNRNKLRKQVKDANASAYSGIPLGSESEYNWRGILEDLNGMFIDITTLTKASRRFIQISTASERSTLATYLSNMSGYFSNPQSSQFINAFDNTKKMLRDFNVRSFSERQIQFDEELQKLMTLKVQINEELNDIKSIKSTIQENAESIENGFKNQQESIESLDEGIETLEAKKLELEKNAEKFDSILESLETTDANATEQLEEITSSMNSAKSNEKLISSFALNVENRDKQLAKIEQRVNENDEKLEVYESERKNILTESKGLIASAKKALNYKAAEGISAAFQEQYVLSSDKKKTVFWLWTAGVAMAVAVVLGIWVAKSSSTEISYILGRVSLIPLVLLVALFAGKQYVRQKNIAEDYAYKMVLSKAIVGFSEQLKKHGTEGNEEYIHYIKRALEEIHKDPLRSRKTVKESKSETASLDEALSYAEKFINLGKNLPS